MKPIIPSEILAQHVAILGKTGSGKTSTAKLAVEQVVAAGARACVLDPIKSDWWGLTSSADGKRAGLPFHILGGPHGHVPLHAAAGKAIAEVVANGSMPLSIIDMADFGPGGHAKFFVDFAPTLLRKMKGVVYLVIEEAHIFAPKERAGIGDENMSIHYAKLIATAGRSKGIRLLLATQRTQALHNALLGSCDTLIAHRLMAPADQAPVIKWLKGNVQDPAIRTEVAESLASLQTGEGWVCAGEARIFKRLKFPRIKTYDNTATPTGDGADVTVKTAAVDVERLRTIIGTAVKDAEDNSPTFLKKRVRELEKQLAKAPAKTARTATESARTAKPADVAEIRATTKRLQVAARNVTALAAYCAALEASAEDMRATIGGVQGELVHAAGAIAKCKVDLGRLVTGKPPKRPLLAELEPVDATISAAAITRATVAELASKEDRSIVRPARGTRHDGVIGAGEQKILIAIAQNDAGVDREQLTILTGYKRSTRDAYIQRLATKGLIDVGPPVRATEAGIELLPADFEPLPTGDALREHWIRTLPVGERAVLEVLAAAHPDAVSRDEITEQTSYKRSTRDAYIRRLTLRKLVVSESGAVRASPMLFD
jgi:hypothetical protein